MIKKFVPTKEIQRLYKEGLSLNEIGEHIGISGQSVWMRLTKSKMKLRTISEAQKIAYKKGRMKSQRGEDNNQWKGGRYPDSRGYIYLYTGVRNRKVFEHRLIWEKHHGKIPDGWIIHHLNGIRDDNRIENLQAIPRKRHNSMSIVEPYQERIRKLEQQLARLMKR